MSTKVRALKSNKLKVLGEICSGAHVTRTEIAAAIGMTPMSISTIVKELMDEHIISEADGRKKETSCGRKPAILELSPRSPSVLAINLSRRVIQIAVMDLRANLRKEYHRDVPEFHSVEEVRGFIFDSIDRVIDGFPGKICGIGFSTFGPVNTERGVILNPKRFNGVGDVELKKPLEERYGIPAVIIHDATASALAENRLGHADAKSLIYVLISTGIGCGFIIDDRIFGGENGLSGELGHVSVNLEGPECECKGRGCLETYISITDMTNEINATHAFTPALTWHDIIALYNGEQGMFQKEFDRFTTYLASAITSLANLLDISTFVLEYEGQECGDRLERLLEEKVRAHMLIPEEKNLRILKSTYGSLSSVIGACSAVVSDIISGKIDIDI